MMEIQLLLEQQLNDGIGTSAGHVRIFSWDGNTWVQMGSDIDGEGATLVDGRFL